jgi:uncharacterized protein DUF4157
MAAPINILQRTCACGAHMMGGGACEECKQKASLTPEATTGLDQHMGIDPSHPGLAVQTKLRVNEPGDVYEQEADRVADQVMRSPTSGIGIGSVPGSALQRREISAGGGRAVPAPVARDIRGLQGHGAMMDHGTRSFMEQRFARDFSHVRIHHGPTATRLAQSVNALAFTVGRDVVFGEGQYVPQSLPGWRMLAHELAHVVQQGGQSNSPHLMRVSPALCSKDCIAPDKKGIGAPSSWRLTLAVDMEQKGLGRLVSGNVGHTWVRLHDNTGTRYSYGFWPQKGFNSKKPFSSVAGCVHHPDTAHEPPNATNYQEKEYVVTKPQFDQALNAAQSVCAAKPEYNLVTYNCTTFGIDVVKAAGMPPPASTTLAIHNPNALYEGIEENKPAGHPGLGALIGGLTGAGFGAVIGSMGGVGGAIAGGLIGGVAGLIGGTLIGDNR